MSVTINISSSGLPRCRPIRLTSYAESLMKPKSATPKTNAGYIVQCGVSVLCLFNDGGPIAGDVRVAKDAGGQVSPTHEGT